MTSGFKWCAPLCRGLHQTTPWFAPECGLVCTICGSTLVPTTPEASNRLPTRSAETYPVSPGERITCAPFGVIEDTGSSSEVGMTWQCNGGYYCQPDHLNKQRTSFISSSRCVLKQAPRLTTTLLARFLFPILILEVTFNVSWLIWCIICKFVCLFEYLMLSLKMIPQSKKSVV